jgi:alkanesulfonate monooxygenase SsuD/methylene tetrahydromethanopterin reductase-like flavin-dependent oxidoreductase (luciferase family)
VERDREAEVASGRVQFRDVLRELGMEFLEDMADRGAHRGQGRVVEGALRIGGCVPGRQKQLVNDSLISPRIEALTMRAALAPVTERVTLGTGALLPFPRRPIQAAQSLASVDLLSGGRLVVAVGAGFPGRFGQPFYTLSEVAWQRRFTRLDETIALWRELWSGATFCRGEILKFDNIPPATLPFRADGPPIWLGGATPAALARTGRLYDGWLPYPPDPADYESGLLDVRKTAAQAGRSPDDITPTLFVSYESTAASRAAAGRSMTMPTPTTACRWRSWRRSRRSSQAPPSTS